MSLRGKSHRAQLGAAVIAQMRLPVSARVRLHDGADHFEAIAAAWANNTGYGALADIAAEPEWEWNETAASGQQMRILTGVVPGYENTEIIAVAMPHAATWSVSFYAARACGAGQGRFAICGLDMAPTFARVLRDASLDAAIDHNHCAPAHPRVELHELNRTH